MRQINDGRPVLYFSLCLPRGSEMMEGGTADLASQLTQTWPTAALRVHHAELQNDEEDEKPLSVLDVQVICFLNCTLKISTAAYFFYNFLGLFVFKAEQKGQPREMKNQKETNTKHQCFKYK